jgi:DNA-directed RNA polymerase specialized sigma24 family protein
VRASTDQEQQLTELQFTAFVEKAEPRLRVALMSAYGPERGREATAEALAYAWEHWDRVEVMEHPVAFLYRVGQSKSRPRKRPRPDPKPPHEDPWVEPKLPAALNRLSRKQRMAVVLVHAFGWTSVEAAGVMGVRPATVRTHEQRGLAKLRKALEVAADD